MNNQLEVQRDRKLEPLQGRALMKKGNLIHLTPQAKQVWYFRPKVAVFLFVAVGGITAFIIGFLSL